jgi:hypothetical protein
VRYSYVIRGNDKLLIDPSDDILKVTEPALWDNCDSQDIHEIVAIGEDNTIEHSVCFVVTGTLYLPAEEGVGKAYLLAEQMQDKASE